MRSPAFPPASKSFGALTVDPVCVAPHTNSDICVGALDGDTEGDELGDDEGAALGEKVGDALGDSVGLALGEEDGPEVGSLGLADGLLV